jgi:mRNA-degrading endonuclease RelE of RelBE toxin-antitoxin system
MMAQTESSFQPFTVEIMPTAWKQIAHLSQDMYRVLRERLRTLADLASAGWHPWQVPIHTTHVQASLSFMMGEFAALYEADTRSRVIRLLEVARRLPTEGARTHVDDPAYATIN